MKTTAQTDTADRQLGFSFDLTTCGPVANAAAERKLLADIEEKVAHDLEMYGEEDVYAPDF